VRLSLSRRDYNRWVFTVLKLTKFDRSTRLVQGYSYFVYKRFSFKFAENIHNSITKLFAVEKFKVLNEYLNDEFMKFS